MVPPWARASVTLGLAPMVGGAPTVAHPKATAAGWPKFQRCWGFLRVCPGSFCCVRELSKHKANGSQVQEGESLAAEALPVFGQPTAAVQPSYGAVDNPDRKSTRLNS